MRSFKDVDLIKKQSQENAVSARRCQAKAAAKAAADNRAGAHSSRLPPGIFWQEGRHFWGSRIFYGRIYPDLAG
jgi:hypothetical protein